MSSDDPLGIFAPINYFLGALEDGLAAVLDFDVSLASYIPEIKQTHYPEVVSIDNWLEAVHALRAHESGDTSLLDLRLMRSPLVYKPVCSYSKFALPFVYTHKPLPDWDTFKHTIEHHHKWTIRCEFDMKWLWEHYNRLAEELVVSYDVDKKPAVFLLADFGLPWCNFDNTVTSSLGLVYWKFMKPLPPSTKQQQLHNGPVQVLLIKLIKKSPLYPYGHQELVDYARRHLFSRDKKALYIKVDEEHALTAACGEQHQPVNRVKVTMKPEPIMKPSPRPIHNIDPLQTLAAAMSMAANNLSVLFDGMEGHDVVYHGKTLKTFINFSSGGKTLNLSRAYSNFKCLNQEGILIFISGDDVALVLALYGFDGFSVNLEFSEMELDLSSCDQTVNTGALMMQYEVYRAMGVSERTIEHLWAMAIAEYTVVSKNGVIKLDNENKKEPDHLKRGQRPTGGPDTSKGNTIVVFAATITVLQEVPIEHWIDESRMIRQFESYGFVAKWYNKRNATFLKGVFLPAPMGTNGKINNQGLAYIWICPLPGTFFKWFKTVTDPVLIAKSRKTTFSRDKSIRIIFGYIRWVLTLRPRDWLVNEMILAMPLKPAGKANARVVQWLQKVKYNLDLDPQSTPTGEIVDPVVITYEETLKFYQAHYSIGEGCVIDFLQHWRLAMTRPFPVGLSHPFIDQTVLVDYCGYTPGAEL